MNKTNNQIRREEFEKRRVYKGTLSKCQAGYDCPVFMNCLLEINQLKKQLEEKDKVIDEAINFIEEHSRKEPPYYECLEFYNIANLSELLEILERSKE